jgi:ABC-type transport system involved in multi-copper enzyme maturation permease subunit
MFTTLLIKEMHETLINFRFLIAAVLCVVLIPLGIYMSGKEYKYRLNEYQESVRLYHERYEKNTRSAFDAEGYRPPSPLSVFSAGLEDFIPNKILISMDDQFSVENSHGLNNPLSRIAGSFDFVFIVSTVLSMLAFIFTFGAISGEKEQGTLRLVLSNAAPRHVILLAKLTGNFLMFIVPMLVGTLAGIILMIFTGDSMPLDASMIPPITVIIVASILFLLIMFILGVYISSLTRSSVTALVMLLLVWVVLSLVIPKTSPQIAQAILPVKSLETVNMEKHNLREQFRHDSAARQRELFNRMLSNNGVSPENFNLRSEADKGVALAYENSAELAAIKQDFTSRLDGALNTVDQDYRNTLNQQEAIALTIARLSPVSCFRRVVTEVAGTGMTEITIVHENAQRFYRQVKESLYDNYVKHEYYYGNNSSTNSFENVGGNGPQLQELTSFNHTTLNQAMLTSFPDLALLGIYAILFFVLAYVSFLRYDVR